MDDLDDLIEMLLDLSPEQKLKLLALVYRLLRERSAEE